MSGPYIDGLGTKKRRRCEIDDDVPKNDESSSFSSSSDHECEIDDDVPKNDKSSSFSSSSDHECEIDDDVPKNDESSCFSSSSDHECEIDDDVPENEESSSFSSSSDHEETVQKKHGRCKERRVTQTDAELIPTFRPDEKFSNVKVWLHKIDQLGDIYGWNNKDRQFIMHMRLRGSARDWYFNLDDYTLSWKGWKDALETAFPCSTEFVDLLESMLARKKTDSESMTKYFNDKVSLLKKCNIVGEPAISCIIRGLPMEMRANAKAFQCDTPHQLYYGYLSSLEENHKQVEASHGQPATTSTWRRARAVPLVARGTYFQSKKCYACRREGHEAKDCKLPRCEVCHRPGHTSASCWYAASSSHPNVPYNVHQRETRHNSSADRRGTWHTQRTQGSECYQETLPTSNNM